MTWTLLLVGYSWYMMRRSMDFKYSPPPLLPDTLSNFLGPQVTYEYTSLEGLVTWTLVRVRERLRRATENGNIGAAMRYQQMQRWLETCLRHLPTASLQDREKTLNSLSEEHDLSDDDNSLTYGLGKDECGLLSTSHEEIHRCIIRLLELQRVEVTMDLLRTFAETRSERMRRYQNAEQGEVSDPDAWAALHYGRPPESADEETAEELQEF